MSFYSNFDYVIDLMDLRKREREDYLEFQDWVSEERLLFSSIKGRAFLKLEPKLTSREIK